MSERRRETWDIDKDLRLLCCVAKVLGSRGISTAIWMQIARLMGPRFTYSKCLKRYTKIQKKWGLELPALDIDDHDQDTPHEKISSTKGKHNLQEALNQEDDSEEEDVKEEQDSEPTVKNEFKNEYVDNDYPSKLNISAPLSTPRKQITPRNTYNIGDDSNTENEMVTPTPKPRRFETPVQTFKVTKNYLPTPTKTPSSSFNRLFDGKVKTEGERIFAQQLFEDAARRPIIKTERQDANGIIHIEDDDDDIEYVMLEQNLRNH